MSTDIASMVKEAAQAAKAAAGVLRSAGRAPKDRALLAMARLLKEGQAGLLEANAKDVAAAGKAGMAKAMLERLTLTPAKVDAMVQGLREVAALPDPVGSLVESRELANGLKLSKVRVPLGVVGIIYESRPNVTVDAASLCLKSGNATILRGGSEAVNSNVALGAIIQAGLREAGLPEAAVTVIGTPDRAAVNALLKLDSLVDVIIPRGGHGLIRFVLENSSIPVIRHDIGNCHVYVDASADLKMAEDIAFNAKVQRPGVCNAMEHLLVHEKVAKALLPGLFARYRQAGVELRGDAAVQALEKGVKPVAEGEWSEEYLDLIVGAKIVASVDEAIAHINTYGSQHSDAIITADAANAEKFLEQVDSAAVYWNASTRFTDGYEFGLGAEIGISTQKLHARGPMALEELCSVKWVVRGTGQVRG
jgi:glutamate-5-semialdehyde dehydrogenase